jgi:hypothetical protein
MLEIFKLAVLFLTFIFILLLFLTFIINLLVVGVPYVPSKKGVINKILTSQKLKQNSVVYDLGCGDARFLIALEKKFKIKGIGYELAIIPYLLARLNKIRNHSKITIVFQNFFKANLANADLIFCYLDHRSLEKIAKKMKKECRRGTKLISNTFKLEDQKPQQIFPKNNQQKNNIYLYEF